MKVGNSEGRQRGGVLLFIGSCNFKTIGISNRIFHVKIQNTPPQRVFTADFCDRPARIRLFPLSLLSKDILPRGCFAIATIRPSRDKANRRDKDAYLIWRRIPSTGVYTRTMQISNGISYDVHSLFTLDVEIAPLHRAAFAAPRKRGVIFIFPAKR